MKKTAVIYARYSDEKQKDRSIDDQVALCRQIAARHGFTVTKVYADRAVSGASMFERDELLALMSEAKNRSFNAVIAESLDRLSRDQEDTPAIYKRLRFNNIAIIDQHGEVTDVHIGVGGIVNSMFLKNLADKVKRGMNGRVREGLIPGSIAYGYRRGGNPGEREIEPAEAAIVRRIFEEYAEGKTTRDIAAGLNRDKIPSPRGGSAWNHSKMVTGGAGGGMLGNPIYVGKLVWNATNSIKNPDSGKRHFRRTSKEDRIEIDVPHLRIIDDELLNRVVSVRGSRRKEHRYGTYKFVNKGGLLAGLLTCGTCGGSMIIGQTNPDRTPRVVCSYGHRRMNCDHHKSYDLKTLETTVLDGIKAKLTNRAALIELTKAYHGQWAKRQKETRGDRDSTQKQLNRAAVQIDRYVTAIGESDDPVKQIMDKLKLLRVEHASLAERLRIIDSESNLVSLHPKAIDSFSMAMEEMHKVLSRSVDEKRLAPFKAAFRNVFERIVVHPTGKRKPYEVTPYARLGAIMGFEMFPKMRSVTEMLAEQGVSANRTSAPAASRWFQDCNSGVIGLGRWQAA